MTGKRVTVREAETPLAQFGKNRGRGGVIRLAGLDTPDGRWTLRIARLQTRERDVLRLAAAGLDDATIAAWLGVAPMAVLAYWRVIYALLGVTGVERRRGQAIALWRAWGQR